MRWCSWLRHCTTSQVTGSIPDGIIVIFIDIILLATLRPWGWLSLYAPAAFTPQEYFLGVKAARVQGLQPYHLHVLCWNLGASISWNHLGLSRPVIALLYLYCVHRKFKDNKAKQLKYVFQWSLKLVCCKCKACNKIIFFLSFNVLIGWQLSIWICCKVILFISV
jgi:hypothetical protein